VADQRFKKRSQLLDAGRIQKLGELGFGWGSDKTLLDRWEARFWALKEFKEEHGHCNVPSNHPGGLGGWVADQRFKKRSQLLDAGRIQKLGELGFQWSLAKTPLPWEVRFQQLKEFKEEHGHCDVPQNFPGGLGGWVANQRSKKRSQLLDAGRIQKLGELGFGWGSNKTLLDRWEARFWELKEFKEEHGHCNVPARHPGGLGNLVYRQPSKKKSGRLNVDQIQKLEELGVQ